MCIQEYDESVYAKWHHHDKSLQMALDAMFPTTLEEKRWKKANLGINVREINSDKKIVKTRKAAA
ncbi:hypothetical protein HY382_01205 [Candidatus Curtissbacteria bacterium]|nr:hypothetical protein [Candidatus Curtissbacteria bacterium]